MSIDTPLVLTWIKYPQPPATSSRPGAQLVTLLRRHCRALSLSTRRNAVACFYRWPLNRILMVRKGGAVRAVLEVLITKRRPTKWEWRVCDRYGTTIIGGFESTRPAAKYRGNRALFLFLLLSTGCTR